MKEYMQNNIRIRKFSFEDWEKGNFSSSMEPGKRLVKNIPTGEEWYAYLPYPEWKKIQKKSKEIYLQKVSEGVEREKELFARQCEESIDKEQLIDKKINQCDTLLNGWYKPIYDKLVDRRDYQYTNSPNNPVLFGGGDIQFIRVEVLHEFMKWLKDQAKDLLDVTGEDRLTHRQTAIIERFKIENGEMDEYDLSKGWKHLSNNKKNRETAIRSMLKAPNSKSYKAPTKEEVRTVIPFLSDSPKALKYALEYLDKP